MNFFLKIFLKLKIRIENKFLSSQFLEIRIYSFEFIFYIKNYERYKNSQQARN